MNEWEWDAIQRLLPRRANDQERRGEGEKYGQAIFFAIVGSGFRQLTFLNTDFLAYSDTLGNAESVTISGVSVSL